MSEGELEKLDKEWEIVYFKATFGGLTSKEQVEVLCELMDIHAETIKTMLRVMANEYSNR